MEKKLIIGQKYIDKEDGREYELVGIRAEEFGRRTIAQTAILIRGVAQQEVNIRDFWKVFRGVD